MHMNIGDTNLATIAILLFCINFIKLSGRIYDRSCYLILFKHNNSPSIDNQILSVRNKRNGIYNPMKNYKALRLKKKTRQNYGTQFNADMMACLSSVAVMSVGRESSLGFYF